jgi:thiosulfate/3-mercaptopyruvate sulfurtransferase
MLTTTTELAKHLDDPDWVVFDTRHDLMDEARGPKVYAAAHIPGAYFLHVDHDLAGAKTGKNGRHPLPELATFAAKMNRCGVAPHRQVVVYDDMGGNWSVRLWWMLRWLGHAKVSILDGQYPLWVEEGRPVTKEVPPPREGAFVPKPLLGATVDAAYIEAFRADPAAKLIDARTGERFEGRVEPVDPVPGHIPGAVNRFWKDNLDAHGHFKPPEQLRAEFEALLGGTAADRAMHMCGSGVTACHNLFAMELAGLAGSRLYPGSWSEWCADPARPVAKGP